MFSKKNSEEKQKNNTKMNIRIHLNNMEKGKRILLRDGRIGVFKGFNGTASSGEYFSFQCNEVLDEVPLEQFDCVLINNPNVSCPLCSGEHIMDGYIASADGLFSLFRENINKSSVPSYNSRTIHVHACHDCGHAMFFVRTVED